MGMIRRTIAWAIGQMEGRASAHVVAVFAAVFALDSADKGAVGAMALQLQHALRIGKTDLGLLATVTSGVGIVGTISFGWLVDRTNRTRVLALAVALWCVAMAISAAATSYLFLLFSRLALGVVIAAAVPAVASLMGDYFQPHLRGRMYGYVLSGELIGAGIGYILAGELALLSWRLGFLALAVLAVGVAWLVYRLPEPARGGADRIAPGQEHVGQQQPAASPSNPAATGIPDASGPIRDLVHESDVRPREHLVYDVNPRQKSLWWAAWYVVRIPTNLVLIIASALGYYYFAGMTVFGVELAEEWYRVSHSSAIGLVLLFGVGGLAGALSGGRLGDRLLARQYLSARVIVATSAYLAAAIFLIPALLTPWLYLAVPTLILAGYCLGAVNPPLDAARLDIMHPYLWGRAEAVRTALRMIGQAIAPLAFGYTAQYAFGGGAAGLDRTFLVMLVPLFISGGIGFIAFRTYPRDVATADAYTQRTIEKQEADHRKRQS